jgi:hypothetical protein
MECGMSRFLVLVLLTAITAFATESSSPSVPSDQASSVTFNKDVLPILQKNCQTCHRPGEIAPMSFLTYESTRPWAKAIKAAVISKQMPPWFADDHYGQFRNGPKLTEADIHTLSAWADSGAREGESKDKPPSPNWIDGWRIQPDVVVSMQEPYLVPAKGAGEIKQFVIPSPFKEDTWVTSIEIRPGDSSVVHHVILQVDDQDAVRGFVKRALGNCEKCPQDSTTEKLQNALFDFASARIFDGVPQGNGAYSGTFAKLFERMTGQGIFTTMEAVYAPGSQPLDFRFHNSAKLIRGGKPIRLEVHYTPNGKETTDQTKVGFTLATAPAERRFVIMAPEHLADTRKPIPAGESNWETTGELTFNQDAELVWFMPHMHLRGKDMSFKLIDPAGHEETVLNARFNFHWQLGYELENPIKITKGTRMIVTAHHDNSANNPFNPEPDKPVMWGDLTSAEMMLPWFGVVVRGDAQPDMIASYKPAGIEATVFGKLVINSNVVLATPFDSKPQLIVAQPTILQSK